MMRDPSNEFMKKFNCKRGVLVTKNDERGLKTEHGTIRFIPAWKLALRNASQ